MKIKWWQSLCFFIVIIVATTLVFPYDSNLVSIYLDSGMLPEAHLLIDKLLKKTPDNSRLLSLLSSLYQKEGRSKKAIKTIKKAIIYAPDNLLLMERLAILYEWDRDTANALLTWEQIIKADPDNIMALERAVGYYRYLRYLKKESITIAKLVILQNKSKINNYSDRHPEDFLLTLMSRDLQKLATIRIVVNDAPNLDVALGRIYLLTKQYQASLEKLNNNKQQDTIVTITTYLDLLVRTGYVDMAWSFAEALDNHQDTGIQTRLILVKIMRWNEMNKQVLALLSKLEKTYSQNYQIMDKIVNIKEEINNAMVETVNVATTKTVNNATAETVNVTSSAGELLISKREEKIVDQMFNVTENSGNSDNIEEAFSIGSAQRPHDQKIALKVAESFLSINKQKQAIVALETFLKINPADVKVRKKLVEICLWDSSYRKAYQHALYIAKQDGSKNSYLEVVKVAEQGGLIKEGFKIAQELYKKYPTDPTIQKQLIKLASWTNKPKVVASVLSNIADANEKSFKKALRAGNAWVEAGQLKKGMVYLEKALALQPDNIHLKKNLARYYSWKGSIPQMTVKLEQLEKKGLLNDKERIILAQSYIDRKQGQKVIKLYKYLNNAKTMPIQPALILASAYELENKRNLALNIYKRLALENSDNPGLLSKIGNHALWLENTKLALQFFESALKKDSANLAAIKGSGQIYAWNNDAQKAMERFELYNKLNPNDYEVRYQLGELYSTNNRQGDADREYQHALQLINNVKNKHKINLP